MSNPAILLDFLPVTDFLEAEVARHGFSTAHLAIADAVQDEVQIVFYGPLYEDLINSGLSCYAESFRMPSDIKRQIEQAVRNQIQSLFARHFELHTMETHHYQLDWVDGYTTYVKQLEPAMTD